MNIDISDLLKQLSDKSSNLQLEGDDGITIDFVIPVEFYTQWSDSKPLKAETELGIDIETTGENQGKEGKGFASYPERHRIRLIQVYLPTLDQVAVLDLWNLTTDQTRWLSCLMVQLADPKVVKYLQNAIFDAYFIYYKFRVMIRNIRDSRLLSQIQKAGQYEAYKFDAGIDNPNSLAQLAIEHYIPLDKSEQSSDWSALTLSREQLLYSARDPIACYKVGKILYNRLIQSQPLVVAAELGCIEAFVMLQYAGIPADVNDLFQTYSKYHQASVAEKRRLECLMPYDPVHHKKVRDRKDELESLQVRGIKTRKREIVDKPFNVSSASQVLIYLKTLGFDQELLKLDKKTGEEKDSTGRDILFNLYSEMRNAGSDSLNQIIQDLFESERVDYSPFDVIQSIQDIIYVRGITKAASTLSSYLDGYDPLLRRIPTAYNILATQGMGRSSSGDRSRSDVQNCQNVSKHLPSHQRFGLPPIRSISTPRDGYVFAEIDLAASHAQFARFLSKDYALQESYDSGIKLHYYTLASILSMDGISVTPEECMDLVLGKADRERQEHYKHLYKLSKIVFYCFLNYGGGATLQGEFFKFEQFVSLSECKKYLEACTHAFFKLREFQDKTYQRAMGDRTLLTLPNDTYVYFCRSFPIDGSIVYHRVNTDNGKFYVKISDVVSVQWMRPEATVMKSALAQVAALILDDWKDNCRLVNFSHDSMMLEIRQELVGEILPVACEIVDASMRWFIPDYKAEEGWESCVKKYSWEK